MSDHTAELQAELDGNIPVLDLYARPESDPWMISTLRIGPKTHVRGHGRLSVLKTVPGNTEPFLLRNRDLQSRRIWISDLTLDCHRAAGETVGGIQMDHTGLAPGARSLHQFRNLTILNSGSIAYDLKRCGQIYNHNMQIEFCKRAVVIDGTSYDGEYSSLSVGQIDEHGVECWAGGYFNDVHAWWTALTDPTKAAFYIGGWATGGTIRGKFEDGFGQGLVIEGVGLPRVWEGWQCHIKAATIEGDVLRIISGHKNVITVAASSAQANGSIPPSHLFDSVVNMSGTRNVVQGSYTAESLKPDHAAALGDLSANTVTLVAH
jgi:hypothetical protein